MKNLSAVREFVFEEIAKLQSGKTDAKKLTATINALNFILKTAQFELAYAKSLNKNPKMDFFEVELQDTPQKQIK